MRNLAMMAVTAALLAGCTNAPPPTQSTHGVAQLQALLAGKTAGPATNCIPGFQGGSPSVVTPTNVAFVVNPSLVYVSDVQGSGCEDAADPSNVLVTKSTGIGLCQGDTLRILDPQTRVLKGACTLSNFVPYRRAS